MRRSKCISCSEYKNCRDSFTSWVFFIIGLIATVAIRVVTILLHANPFYAKIAWYIGVGGFFLFFVYKFKINQTRGNAISQKRLLDKINLKEQLQQEDYSTLSAILCALSSRKERINYIFIFALSALALLFAVYIDFFK